MSDNRDELIACCKELQAALLSAVTAMADADNVTRGDVCSAYLDELARICCDDGIVARAEAVIARAEGERRSL